jgi:signal peptidase
MLKIIVKIISGLVIMFLILVALLLITSTVPIPGNIKVFNVLTGSMEPKIKTGSMVIVRQAENYKIGDIITFVSSNKVDRTPITHRIHDMKIKNGSPFYITKGDANEVQDSGEIGQKQIIGKLIFKIPFIGAVVNVAKTPIGFTLLIIIPAVIFIYEEIKKIIKEITKPKNKENEEKKEI